MDAVDFLVDWKSLIGQTVTVVDCMMVKGVMSAEFIACRSDTDLIDIDSKTLAREDLRRILRNCPVGPFPFEVDEKRADFQPSLAALVGPASAPT